MAKPHCKKWLALVAEKNFPQREALGFDSHELSPGIIERIVHTAAEVRSYRRAEVVMQKVAGTRVADNTIQRVVTEVGAELARRRDADPKSADALARRPEGAPPMAVVECDGGRIRVRAPGQGRGVHFKKSAAPAAADDQPTISADARAKEDSRRKNEGWRETKNACFISARYKTFEEDPQPEPPACFFNPEHVAKIAQTQALSTAAPDCTVPPTAKELAEELAPPPDDGDGAKQDWRPQRVLRTVVASMTSSRQFGRQMAREAKARRFEEAQKKAFLGDGLGWNWTIHATHFASYTPILDFIHPLSYLHQAAKKVHRESKQDAWSQYSAWMRGCWQGEIDQVLEELRGWQAKLGLPEKTTPDEDPRAVVATTIRYLENNRERMNYPQYRREGMPVTTAWMESTVKEMNYRVKGTEMYWDDPADPILQVRAASLSDDERLTRHTQSRPGCPFTRRPKSPILNC